MKLAVVGSRTFNDYNLLVKYLNFIHNKEEITLIISGGAKGADKMSEYWAKDHNIETKIFIPEWNKQGTFNRRAGFERNELIIKECDKVVAFWDGESNGTRNDISLAKKYNKKCLVIDYNKLKENN